MMGFAGARVPLAAAMLALPQSIAVGQCDCDMTTALPRDSAILLAISIPVVRFDMTAADSGLIALFLAILETETNFVQDALNEESGAAGMAQLLCSTADWIVPEICVAGDNRGLGLERNCFPMHPFVNMHLGFAYLWYLTKVVAQERERLNINDSKGYYRPLLIGYHAGQENLLRHGLRYPGPRTRRYQEIVLGRKERWSQWLTETGLPAPVRLRAVYRRFQPCFVSPYEAR